MIDKAKRKTLKVMSATAGVAAVPGSVLATSAMANSLQLTADTISPDDALLAEIKVNTRVSAIHNDIEIVLTNSGSEPVTITHMTPSVTRVARGEFDFSKLLKEGPLHLTAGESVTVPLEHKAVKMWTSPDGVAKSTVQNPALSDRLRNAISVVTEGNSFASVTVA